MKIVVHVTPLQWSYLILSEGETGTGIAMCIGRALAQSGAIREDANYVNASCIIDSNRRPNRMPNTDSIALEKTLS
ncbi:unnamed protein product [Linum trigynum]|uniref:Uncharacterized protein n=1 Tax=Linum trigynum TaxID=586398 RepID=A0AAV2FMM6_9ROSI